MKKSQLKALIKEVIEEISKKNADGRKILFKSGSDYIIKGYKDLPSRFNYGFFVFPNLKIGVVNTYQGHKNFLDTILYKNPRLITSKWKFGRLSDERYAEYLDDGILYEELYKQGMVELVKAGDEQMYIRFDGNKSTIKLAKDIAMLYGLQPVADNSGGKYNL